MTLRAVTAMSLVILLKGAIPALATMTTEQRQTLMHNADIYRQQARRERARMTADERQVYADALANDADHIISLVTKADPAKVRWVDLGTELQTTIDIATDLQIQESTRIRKTVARTGAWIGFFSLLTGTLVAAFTPKNTKTITSIAGTAITGGLGVYQKYQEGDPEVPNFVDNARNASTVWSDDVKAALQKPVAEQNAALKDAVLAFMHSAKELQKKYWWLVQIEWGKLDPANFPTGA